MSDSSSSYPVRLRIGHEELTIRYRYETLSIVNDFLIAAWFIVGSLMFFHSTTEIIGTWCFLAGSIELAIRPTIRLVRHIHLRRIPAKESDQDF